MYRGERDPHGGGHRLAMELLGGDMPVAALEQELGKCQPRAGGARVRRAQQFEGIGEGA